MPKFAPIKKSGIATLVAAAAVTGLTAMPAHAAGVSSIVSAVQSQITHTGADGLPAGPGPGGLNGAGYSDGAGQLGSLAQPTEWCADFAGWAWAQGSASHLDFLDGGAASFYDYGTEYGTLSSTPAPGDAVVFSYNSSSDYAAHVEIVTSVSGGTITAIGGNENDEVEQDTFADSVGTSTYNGTISGYVAPVTSAPVAPPATPEVLDWLLSTSVTSSTNTVGSFNYGNTPMVPLSGDWTGQGHDTPGAYNPSNSHFYLANTFNGGVADTTIFFGDPGDKPVVGNWDGGKTTEVGVYRQSNATFYLRHADGTVTSFTVGNAGNDWIPVAGDWTGSGHDSVGLYDPDTRTFYLRNSFTSGAADTTTSFGNTGDVPLAGDWDGTGTGSIGVFRPSNHTFYFLHTNGTTTSISYGSATSTPVVGDWSGTGTDTQGVIDS